MKNKLISKMKKLSNNKKRLVVTLLCIAIILSNLFNITMCAVAGSRYEQLGTNEALGSPILNSNFTIEDWNKWEMICWGVFLSNFCTPLVDNYNTAFHTGNGGSDGNGYKALVFGSGSDSENNKTIQELTDYACLQQKGATKTIYVSYSQYYDGTLFTHDINAEDAVIREATFIDLFFNTGKDKVVDENGYGTYSDAWGTTTRNYVVPENYTAMTIPENVMIPTFYIKSGTSYIKILDFCDPWDIQVYSMLVNKLLTSGNEDTSLNKFSEIWKENPKLSLDNFANIVINDNVIVFPSSCNQNITKSPSINLLNSWVFNGYNNNNVTKDKLITQVKQSVPSVLGIDLTGFANSSCLPALGGSDSILENGTVALYYDLDTVEFQNPNIEYGDALLKLYSEDISNNNRKLNLKIEAVNDYNVNDTVANLFDYGKQMFTNCQMTACMLSNILTPTNGKQPTILSDIVMPSGEKVKLFNNNGIAIPVQVNASNNSKDGCYITRCIDNYIFDIYKGNIGNTANSQITASDIVNILQDCKTREALGDAVDLRIYDNYCNTYPKFDKPNKYSANQIATSFAIVDMFSDINGSAREGSILDIPRQVVNFNIMRISGGQTSTDYDINGNDSFSQMTPRVIVMYQLSDTLRSVGNIFALKDNTDFANFSTVIYMTYLDFYGIIKKNTLTSGTTQVSEFKPELFDVTSELLNVDIGDLIEAKSEDEIEAEIKNYTYMMLNPELGQTYRTEMLMSDMDEFIYKQYIRAVYGSDNSYSNITSTSSNGFLSIEPYDKNFFTSWFLKIYSKLSVILIGGFFIAMIVIGLMQSKKLSWFLITSFVIVNTILIMPSCGEIVPYVASRAVQQMFSNKMTYWAISQDTYNSNVENNKTYELNGLTQDEKEQVLYILNMFENNNLDRSLMIKRDISTKVTMELNGVYTQVQNMKSARWLLPTIMQQYSQGNGEADYVYTSLGNLYDDMENLDVYWESGNANLILRAQNRNIDGIVRTNTLSELYGNRCSIYQDYCDTTRISQPIIDISGINYRAYSYNNRPSEELTHNVSYLLPNTSCYSRILHFKNNEYNNINSFNSYIDASSSYSTNYINKAEEIEKEADQYNRQDLSTMKTDYGYLWSTETPINFFYENIVESFNSADSLASVIGNLIGKYEYSSDGREVRNNFMYATDNNELSTGYIRDICDLQSLFTNMIPYLYQVQLVTGGNDGNGGVLQTVDENGNITPRLISSELSLYEGERLSWLYRCNWVVKLMENSDYNKEMIVRDSDGNRYIVKNPLLYEMYPSNRPMVYSEAQMKAMNLKESDLNLVELKCIECNKQIARKWTLLVNYASTNGMTKDILFRQMALDALLQFNNEFNPSGIVNNAYKMYPTTIDLRNISFDSVMKMLMLNVTNNSYFTSGDTMRGVIENSDSITSILLLLVAYMNAYIIPFIVQVLMALIFYLGFLSILRALTSDNKFKAKVACGQLISNILFLVITIFYYECYSLMLTLTSNEDILVIDNISSAPGNPVWVLLVALIVSIVYTALLFNMITFCYKNYKDMGFEVYKSIASSFKKNLTETVGHMANDIKYRSNENKESRSSTSSTHIIDRHDSSNTVLEKDNRAYSNNANNNYKNKHNKYKSNYYSNQAMINRAKKVADNNDDKNSTNYINEQIRRGKSSTRKKSNSNE